MEMCWGLDSLSPLSDRLMAFFSGGSVGQQATIEIKGGGGPNARPGKEGRGPKHTFIFTANKLAPTDFLSNRQQDKKRAERSRGEGE